MDDPQRTSGCRVPLGLPGSFPPCAIRIRAGAREVDPTYRPDLNTLTASPATLVEELPADTGVTGFDTFDGRGFLTRDDAATSTATWFDLSQSPIRETLRFNGLVVNFARLGGE